VLFLVFCFIVCVCLFSFHLSRLVCVQAGHEAVAVTGENGRLEGSVSVCSLRGLTVDELHGLLDRPAGEFAVTRTRDMITTTAQVRFDLISFVV
jgi:hypothetical protein